MNDLQKASVSDRSGRRIVRGRVVAAAIAVATVFAIGGLTMSAHADGSAPPSPVPTGSADAGKAQHQQYEKNLVAWQRAHPRPKPDLAQASAEAKKSGEEAAHQTQADPSAPSTRVAGIDDSMHQGPFAATEFSVSNFYQGPANGTWLLVYSGATRNTDTGATIGGAIRIYAMPDPDSSLTEIGTFSPTPSVGPLRVTDSNGSHLVLTSDDGTQLGFDLDTDQFVAP